MNTDKLLVIAALANDYHSGQRSKGYKILCRAIRLLARKGISRPLDMKLNDAQMRMYNSLSGLVLTRY